MKNKNLVLALLISALMSGNLFASNYKKGTYIGTSAGYKSQIKVELTVSKDKIEKIEVIEFKDTPLLTDLAKKRIPEDIVKYQTLAIDTVAGATSSSRGVIGAVTNALKVAGADINTLRKNKIEIKHFEPLKPSYSSEVIIIGGGGAGLAAAVSAHENGSKVIVIDKMPQLGGNTLISGAAFNAVNPKKQKPQNIDDSKELFFKQTYEGGDKKADASLVKILTHNATSTISWVENHGVEFQDKIVTALGALHARTHKPVKPVGTGYVEAFRGYLEKNNVEIFTETEALQLIEKDGRIVGVKVMREGVESNFMASKGVVLATGGFAGNIELRQKYNKNLTEDIPTTNHPKATGDGIKLAETVGANFIGMEHIQLLPIGDPISGSLSGNVERQIDNTIFVNMEGKRFVAEDERRDVMTNALFEQTDSTMWLIVDAHSYENENQQNFFNESIGELLAKSRAFKGQTIEELAEKIDINPITLKKTIDEYNEGIDKGQDKFGRKKYGTKIDKAPYYAGARVPTVHHTMGGVQINTKTQVLNKDGKVIPGLYAAGEVTGGIHGTNRLGGNALTDINVFGKLAGEEISKEKN
ncbi:MAG: flavocytochrome c [Cetobacterium sp.]